MIVEECVMPRLHWVSNPTLAHIMASQSHGESMNINEMLLLSDKSLRLRVVACYPACAAPRLLSSDAVSPLT